VRGGTIHLQKSIPSPGGLGGGSSNAAVALLGLRRLWGLNVSDEELAEIGGGLGSDVPFFLNGGTAIGSGRGEIIEALSDINEPNLLIVTPDVSIPTADVFRSLGAATLTKQGPDNNLTVCRKDAESFDPRHSVLKNDLEPSVFARFPEVERVKKTLLDLGAVNAAMSGSGASVFAIFDKQETRQAARDALASERDWRKFAVSTISRSEYAGALGMA
jgi:4-diphosphocytidyl-2-C-methyl-D-erythritol kinase